MVKSFRNALFLLSALLVMGNQTAAKSGDGLDELERLVRNKICPANTSRYSLLDVHQECSKEEAAMSQCSGICQSESSNSLQCSNRTSRANNIISKYNNQMQKCDTLAGRHSSPSSSTRRDITNGQKAQVRSINSLQTGGTIKNESAVSAEIETIRSNMVKEYEVCLGNCPHGDGDYCVKLWQKGQKEAAKSCIANALAIDRQCVPKCKARVVEPMRARIERLQR